jgi:hypothetical protein
MNLNKNAKEQRLSETDINLPLLGKFTISRNV